jgi:malonate-semialdehyde dehydrogenase (acetylating)/methylmalonate-semialdehyde dehydrogenase
VKAISFVGSSATARYVYGRAAQHGKRVQAFGGGKNHMIVMPDADFQVAASAAASAGFESAGERCMAVSVIVAVGDAGDPVVEHLAERGRSMPVGDGMEPDVLVGPLVTREHRDRVAGYIASAAEQGAKVVLDGRNAVPESEGFFLGPSVIDEVSPDMDCYKDEIFGPVICVVRADSYEDAIRLVNAHSYGNGAVLYTKDGATVNRFENEAQAGMIGVNVAMPAPVSWFSFGGWKGSAFGDRRIFGPEAVDFYTRLKTVTTQWS